MARARLRAPLNLGEVRTSASTPGGGVVAFLARRLGDDAVIGLELQRELSCALPVVGFLFASSGRQSQRQGKKRGDDRVATCVANPQTTCVVYTMVAIVKYMCVCVYVCEKYKLENYTFHLKLC